MGASGWILQARGRRIYPLCIPSEANVCTPTVVVQEAGSFAVSLADLARKRFWVRASRVCSKARVCIPTVETLLPGVVYFPTEAIKTKARVCAPVVYSFVKTKPRLSQQISCYAIPSECFVRQPVSRLAVLRTVPVKPVSRVERVTPVRPVSPVSPIRFAA